MKNIGRTFHLGDILSITTGHLVSPRHVEGIYDILDYMTRDNLYAHQILRAYAECVPYLLEQLPFLHNIKFDVADDEWQSWLNRQIEEYGETHSVYPIPQEDHKYIDPYEEAIEMMGNADKVIRFEIKNEEPPNIGDINWKVD